MESVFLETAKVRPEFLTWIVKYGTLWFHQPVYQREEGEVGDGGVLRYFGHVRTKKSILLFYF